MRIYQERGIRREGVMDIAMANPMEFDRPDEVTADVVEWLRGPDFFEHPVVTTREEAFKRRWRETDREQRLVLELIAAHCLHPGDSTNHREVFNDFIALLTGQGLPREAAVTRFNTAFDALLKKGLVGSHLDPQRPQETPIGIAKQWWALTLDALRREGHRL